MNKIKKMLVAVLALVAMNVCAQRYPGEAVQWQDATNLIKGTMFQVITPTNATDGSNVWCDANVGNVFRVSAQTQTGAATNTFFCMTNGFDGQKVRLEYIAHTNLYVIAKLLPAHFILPPVNSSMIISSNFGKTSYVEAVLNKSSNIWYVITVQTNL